MKASQVIHGRTGLPSPKSNDHPPHFSYSSEKDKNGFVPRLLLKIFLSRIRPLPDQVERIRNAAKEGAVVYAQRSRSRLESYLCQYQSRIFGLPVPAFSFDNDLSRFQSAGKFLRQTVKNFLGRKPDRHAYPYDRDVVKDLLRSGQSIILYLEDMDAFARRFFQAAQDPFRILLEIQQFQERPIFVVPQMVIWELTQEKRLPGETSSKLEQAKVPSKLRTLWNFLGFFRKGAHISQSEPVNLKRFMEETSEEDPQIQAQGLKQTLRDKLRQERRIIKGPIARPRQDLMERVLFDERVQKTIERRMKNKGKNPESVRKEAYRIIKEIAADLDLNVVNFWDIIMTWALKKLYNGVEVDFEGLEKVKQAARHANLVMIPCHKSHMDYLILAYVFYHNHLFPPLIAAGLNLAFWPMGYLFRKSGAFFIRRNFRGSILYPAIFTRYVRVLLEDGYPLEYFIEGGRSRSGKLVLPKLGLLSILIDGCKAGECKDIAFVPIAITYERVMEEGSYIKEIEGGEKTKENFWGLLRSRSVIRKRYGKIYINFNDPISLNAYLSRTLENPESAIRYTRHNVPDYLAYEIAHGINQVMTVAPTALCSASILSLTSKGFTAKEIRHLIYLFYEVLKEEKARFPASLGDKVKLSKTLGETLEYFQKEKLIRPMKEAPDDDAEDGDDLLYEVRDRSRRSMDYYKNSILHYFLPYAMVSVSVLSAEGMTVPLEHILKDTELLRNLFRQEFVFLPDEDTASKIKRALMHLVRLGLLREIPGGVTVLPGRRQDLLCFARLIQNYFESYFIVGSSVRYIGKRRLSRIGFLLRVRFMGHRFHQTGRIQLPESISNVNFNNAIQFLVDQKIIIRQVDKSIREGTYFSLTKERRKIFWKEIKRFLRVYR